MPENAKNKRTTGTAAAKGKKGNRVPSARSAGGQGRAPAAQQGTAKAAAKATGPAKRPPGSAPSAMEQKPPTKPVKNPPKGRSGAKAKPAAAKPAVAMPAAAKPTAQKANRTAKEKAAVQVQANPVAAAANSKNAASGRREPTDDLFLERRKAPKSPAPQGNPPKRHTALFGALNACLVIAIAVLVALGVRQHRAYGEFLEMRSVVDQQTFYEGTTVEGVDVSRMTLSDAMNYWGERVEARNAARTVTLDDGTTVTAQDLGYSSDYAAVLSAAWSAGRSGTLEERYRMASSRRRNPAAYAINRTDYSETLVNQFVQMQTLKIDQDPVDAAVADFDVDTYEFTFTPSVTGKRLDAAALKRDLIDALENGGGSVTLSVEELPPNIATEQVAEMYGLIDYAVTNASSSSKARLNNIKLAMSLINGARLAPGETFSFNERVGQRTAARGFQMATAYSGGEVTEQVGGGICQVSTTLFNAAVKADLQIDERYNHSLTVAYVDKGKDATVDWGHQDLKFTNTTDDDIFICCYLTEDKRVRFGIFGRLLPNGEKITLDAVTTEVIKFDTEYQPNPALAAGQTVVAQNGRNGYKAEAYKVRWDAEGNQLSRELLCSSLYKVKNEIIEYGA